MEQATTKINNTDLGIKEIHGQRVVTFKDVDELHSRPDGTAGRNFRENKKHFIEGEDYYKLCVDEIRRNNIMDISPKTHQDIVFLTEIGYLMLVKSFTGKLTWKVQRQLINGYFRAKQNANTTPSSANCTVLNNTIKMLQSMQKTLTDCSLEHGYLLQNHEQQLDNLHEEIEMLENSFEMQNTDLKDEIQNEFYHINEAIKELKNNQIVTIAPKQLPPNFT